MAAYQNVAQCIYLATSINFLKFMSDFGQEMSKSGQEIPR
jgi:hypothetical protein